MPIHQGPQDTPARDGMVAAMIWLCPFAGVDPRETTRQGGPPVVALHCHGDVRRRRVGSLTADVVVVDAETSPPMDYDPATMLKLLLERIPRPPRHLVAVLKHGVSSGQSQQAFAAEMHRMCGINTTLVLEHAVGYVTSHDATASKHQAVRQHRMWNEIAALAAALAVGGSPPVDGVDLGGEAVRLVEAMLDYGGHSRISNTDRRILAAIATLQSDADEHQLARVLHLRSETVRKRLAWIADALCAPGDPRRERNGSPRTFCAGIASRYAAWLGSFATRRELR